MTEQAVIDVGAKAALLAIKMAAPSLISVMVAGLCVSVFQAATQISEQTMSFIPKVVAMAAAFLFTAPWIIQNLIFFTKDIFSMLPRITQ